MTTSPLATITLEVHVCGTHNGPRGHSYTATFEGPHAEAMAVDFYGRKMSTCAFFEVEEVPVSRAHAKLLDKLYPTCEHGMSADLCYGPAHYVSDAELAMGW